MSGDSVEEKIKSLALGPELPTEEDLFQRVAVDHFEQFFIQHKQESIVSGKKDDIVEALSDTSG